MSEQDGPKVGSVWQSKNFCGVTRIVVGVWPGKQGHVRVRYRSDNTGVERDEPLGLFLACFEPVEHAAPPAKGDGAK